MIVYLHGFRSSPLSFKARLLARRMAALGRAAEFACPQLPASPRAAVALVRESWPPGPADTLIGSSLGGFYATWLAEQTGCRAVLLNPAVRPATGLAAYVGPQTMYHSDVPFEFRAEYLDELSALEVPRITQPQRYFLVAAKGDELLDWRDMVAHYPGAAHKVLEGSDHGLADFADYMDQVLAFAGVTGAAPAADAGRAPSAAPLSPSAAKVQQALDAAGAGSRVVELATSARTVQEAADALGVVPGQIAKSLVFRAHVSGRAVLVIAAGDHRVSEDKVAALLGERIDRASAAFVREHTGFAIGGIPPLGHAGPMVTFVDRTLARFPVVWAAAGTPHAVFPIAPPRLFELAGGAVADVAA